MEKKKFSYLMDYVKTNNIKNIQLTVDINNYKALNLYLKYNLKIEKITNKHYLMKYNNSIELPVSMGESLDKLTILDIKMKKIKDNRKDDVEKEFNILNVKLDIYKKEYEFYYNILLTINESIWDMQDQFRDSKNSQEQNKLCIQIIKENDNRFRVKKKINNLSDSNLKEQKGYKPKKAFVLTHLGLGDNITAIGMVRYFSVCYDEVIVVCKNKNKTNVESFYSDDKNIKIFGVENDKNISPKYGFNINSFKHITNNYSTYLCGYHNLENKYINYENIPFSFYEQINLCSDIFWDYFHIPLGNKSKELYQIVNNVKYVFIHNSSSIGNVFNISDVENKFNLKKYNILFINPNSNCYSKEDKFYELANNFINYKLCDYIEIIKNAEYNILSDSSFFCLSINLDIKNNNNYYISRNNVSYDLYSKQSKFNNINRKEFKQIII
jgi:hypothetical protein